MMTPGSVPQAARSSSTPGVVMLERTYRSWWDCVRRASLIAGAGRGHHVFTFVGYLMVRPALPPVRQGRLRRGGVAAVRHDSRTRFERIMVHGRNAVARSTARREDAAVD